MSDIAIRVEGLSKEYRIGAKQERYRTLRDTLTDAALAPLYRLSRCFQRSGASNSNGHTTIWALKDVSFEVKRGGLLGVIGRNGAGKSTLLKTLSRITEPTGGRAEIHGRVGSLLEVGTGFHPELTGRENIYLNGAILGMRRAEIERLFDEIVAFAEVEQFIDTPVKHYSSGMYLRLAFAVAANLSTEVLLVDEVLAVGDLIFQKKCLEKMGEVAKGGRTVLFVSHDLTAISRLTHQTVFLDDGRVRYLGATESAIRLYGSQMYSRIHSLQRRTDRTGDGIVRINSIGFYDRSNHTTETARSGEALTIQLNYESSLLDLVPEDFSLDLHFRDPLGHPVATVSTRFRPLCSVGKLAGCGLLACRIPRLTLAADTYSIDFWLSYHGGIADCVSRAAELSVLHGDYFGSGQEPVRRKHGAGLIDHNWTVQLDTTNAITALRPQKSPLAQPLGTEF